MLGLRGLGRLVGVVLVGGNSFPFLDCFGILLIFDFLRGGVKE